MEQKRRLSFKEKREMQQLEELIEKLTAEKIALETELSSGNICVDRITEAGKRLPQLTSELDEAELRYLELLEIEG